MAAIVLVVAVGIAGYFGLMRTDRDASRPTAATTTAPPVVAPSRAVPAGSDIELKPTDHVLGDPGAPVTILEYSSLTCPHCARFHIDALPEIRAKYIDTGKAKLVYRDFPLDGTALRAAALAECVAPERYYGFLETLFEGQASWVQAQDPLAALSKLARVGGLSEQAVADCLGNEQLQDDIAAERLEGEQTYDIRSTPTFIIDGRTYSGALTIEQFDSILAPLVD